MFGRRRAGGAGRRPMFALDDARLVHMRPSLDRRIAKAEPGSRKAAGALSLRALAHRAAGDHEASLDDADAALAAGTLGADVEHLAVWAFAEAVIALARADRYEEAVARLESVSTEALEATTAQNLRVARVQLLGLLGREAEARAVLRKAPLEVYPGRPGYAGALVARAHMHLDAGRLDAALDDIDAAVSAGLDDELVGTAANLGAYTIAVLDRSARIEEALAWANLACTAGPGGAEPSLALRETRAAVLAVAGRPAEALPDLQAGLDHIAEHQPNDPSLAWSHAFLARAHLDAGSVDVARHHAAQADELGARHGVPVPVLDAMRDRLR